MALHEGLDIVCVCVYGVLGGRREGALNFPHHKHLLTVSRVALVEVKFSSQDPLLPIATGSLREFFYAN